MSYCALKSPCFNLCIHPSQTYSIIDVLYCTFNWFGYLFKVKDCCLILRSKIVVWFLKWLENLFYNTEWFLVCVGTCLISLQFLVNLGLDSVIFDWDQLIILWWFQWLIILIKTLKYWLLFPGSVNSLWLVPVFPKIQTGYLFSLTLYIPNILLLGWYPNFRFALRIWLVCCLCFTRVR